LIGSAGRAQTGLATLGATFARIEREVGGRLGVFVIDAASGETAGLHADDRFPMCSTFKLLAAAALLARVDSGAERLDRRITFRPEDLVVYSPVTKERTGPPGMSLAELCEAAVTLSDNTAANLILAAIGGPQWLTAYARSLGYTQTRLDRIEPHLNEAAPGDPRDTTTPAAMARNLRTLVNGPALSAASRAQLIAWLMASRTGADRLRAGLPKDWRVGDKTGAGSHGTANDVGVAWPPGRPPVFIAAYLTQSSAAPEMRSAAIAKVARAVAAAMP
jgi:beta-lactamase class A